MEATSTTAVATRTRWAALDLSAIAAFGLGAVLVGWVAADDGGWWPETWAWTALITLGASVVILLVHDRPLGRLDLAFLGGLLAFGAWTTLSALWSPSVPSTLDETQRVLGYVGCVVLALLVVDKRTVRHLLGGILKAYKQASEIRATAEKQASSRVAELHALEEKSRTIRTELRGLITSVLEALGEPVDAPQKQVSWPVLDDLGKAVRAAATQSVSELNSKLTGGRDVRPTDEEPALSADDQDEWSGGERVA